MPAYSDHDTQFQSFAARMRAILSPECQRAATRLLALDVLHACRELNRHMDSLPASACPAKIRALIEALEREAAKL